MRYGCTNLQVSTPCLNRAIASTQWTSSLLVLKNGTLQIIWSIWSHLPASMHQYLDDTKIQLSSKNWCWLVGIWLCVSYLIWQSGIFYYFYVIEIFSILIFWYFGLKGTVNLHLISCYRDTGCEEFAIFFWKIMWIEIGSIKIMF